MHQFQKIVFGIAVGMMGFSIWYYLDMAQSVEEASPVVSSPIPEDVSLPSTPEFDVRHYGVNEADAPAMNAFFAEVRAEATAVIRRDEKLVISLSDLKTPDPYQQKLYEALTLSGHLKVISPATCDRLKKKLADAAEDDLRQKIMRTPEYVICFPGKW